MRTKNIYYWFLFGLFILLQNLVYGQGGEMIDDTEQYPVYTILILVIIEIIVVVALMVRFFRIKKQVAHLPQGKEDVSWFDSINGMIAQSREGEIDTGHDYDGIRELDNRLPGWWINGFYITIIFSVIYIYYFHFGSGLSSEEEYDRSVKRAEMEVKQYLAKAGQIDETNVKILKDKESIDKGREVFVKNNCGSCHGPDAQGAQIGPNLADEYWIHGGSIQDIFKTIKYGYKEKGMQAWQDVLSAKEIAQVASYLKSIKGSKPEGAKEKQGELYTGE